MGFMVFKSTVSNSRIQCKNRFWKMCTDSYDITKKFPKSAFQTKPAKFDTLWPTSRHSVHIWKPIFELKQGVRVGRFEYHGPYSPNDFFSVMEGSEPFWPFCLTGVSRPLNMHFKSVLMEHQLYVTCSLRLSKDDYIKVGSLLTKANIEGT